MPRRPPITLDDLEAMQAYLENLQAGQMAVLDGMKLLNARVNTAVTRLKNKRPRAIEVA